MSVKGRFLFTCGRWFYPTARIYEFLAFSVGLGLAAYIHPQVPHVVIKLYELCPFFFEGGLWVVAAVSFWVVLATLCSKIANLDLQEASIFHVFVMLVCFGVMFVCFSRRDVALFQSSTLSVTTLTVIPDTEIVDPPAFNTAALLRRNFVGENGEGWAFRRGNEVLTVVPKVVFRPRIAWPIASMLPVWTGDFLVHSDGRVEDLTPDEALRDSRLRDIPLYPPLILDHLWAGYEMTRAGGFPFHDPPFDPFLLKTPEAYYWAMPVADLLPDNNQPRITRFLVVNARTGQVSFARLQVFSKDFGNGKIPIFSDGRWQPSRVLIEEGSNGQFQIADPHGA